MVTFCLSIVRLSYAFTYQLKEENEKLRNEVKEFKEAREQDKNR